jgi:hypothetical protein
MKTESRSEKFYVPGMLDFYSWLFNNAVSIETTQHHMIELMNWIWKEAAMA